MIIRQDKKTLQLLKDAYWSIGGFKTGNYLQKAPKEATDKFTYRKEVTNYSNFTRPSVNNNLLDIFNGITQSTDNDIANQFLMDCDGNGTSYNDFNRVSAIKADLYGWVIHMLDTPVEQPDSVSEMKKERTFPRLYRLDPLDVIEYELVDNGKLHYFAWSSVDSEGDTVYSIYYEGKIYNDTLPLGVDSSLTPAELSRKEGRAVVAPPVVLTFNVAPDNNVLPVSSYLSVVYTNKAIYQLESLIQYQGLITSFSVLVYPGKLGPKGLIFGENNILQIPSDTANKAEYLTPENTLERLREQINELRENIFISADLNLLYTSGTVSDAAKKRSDSLRQRVLKSKSSRMSNIDKLLMSYFFDIIKATDDYSTSYPTDFESLTLSQRIVDAQNILELGISKENVVRVRNDILQQYFASSSEQDKSDIEDAEIEHMRTISLEDLKERVEASQQIIDMGVSLETETELVKACVKDRLEMTISEAEMNSLMSAEDSNRNEEVTEEDIESTEAIIVETEAVEEDTE